MVYCGAPSRGCQMCRSRRIKCDEGRPTCQKCEKSQRKCPGYRDDFDIVFRNETSATERRARRLKSRKGGTASEVDSNLLIPTLNHLVTSSDDVFFTTSSGSSPSSTFSIPSPLNIPVECQAPCFFMANFVMSSQHEDGKGWFEFLHPLIEQESPDSALATAFGAVSMAALAHRPNARNSRLGLKALERYTKALKATNLALQDKTKQLEDSTLASIIVLSFYETIASENTNVLAWGAHIEGSVQLINRRGKQQLETAVGRSLYRSIRSSFIIHCMSSSRRIKEPIEWWLADANADDDWTHMTNVKLNLEIVQLRADMNEAIATARHDDAGTQRIRELQQITQTLHAEFRSWEQSLPETWQPRTVAWANPPVGKDLSDADHCPGKIDAYDDSFVASSRNMARVSRLFLSGIEVRCAAWLCRGSDYRTTAEYAAAARQASDMVTDILAAVPYHLGLGEHIQKGRLSVQPFGTPTSSQNVAPKALGGVLTIWPLYVAHCSDFATDSQRQWIAGRLKFIREEHGMNQAGVLSRYQLRLPSMIIERDIKTSELAERTTPTCDLVRKGSLTSQSVTTYTPILPSPSSEVNAVSRDTVKNPSASGVDRHLTKVTNNACHDSANNCRSQQPVQSRETNMAGNPSSIHTDRLSDILESSSLDGYQGKVTAAGTTHTAGRGSLKVRLPSHAPYPWLKDLGWVEDV